MTYDGTLLRRSEELRSCGVRDGSTVQITSRMLGAGKHKNEKSKLEKKQVPRLQRPEQMQGPRAEFEPELNAKSLKDEGQKTSETDEESGGDGRRQELGTDD